MNPSPLHRGAATASWIAQLAAAAILGQTLFFKFSGAAESRFIFDTLGVEPWGRIAAGVAELVCVVLLLIPATAVYGALLALGVLGGAIASHVLFLGFEVQGDGGLLFGLALTASLAATTVVALRRRELPLRLGLFAR